MALALALAGCAGFSQYHPSNPGIPKTDDDLTRDMAACRGHEWVAPAGFLMLGWPALLAASIILEETQRACMAERGWTAVTLSAPDVNLQDQLQRDAPLP